MADYWLNLRCRQVCNTSSRWTLTQDHKIWPTETRNIAPYCVVQYAFRHLEPLWHGSRVCQTNRQNGLKQ